VANMAAPARNLCGLAASQTGERGGNWRGGRGHFIGEVLMTSNGARSEWGSNTDGYWF
jgi:hypothetical protein